MRPNIRVALVHDWLTGMRGGEAVLEAISELFLHPTLFTLLYVPNSVSPALSSLVRKTSFLQNIPGIERRYRHFLPLMPKAIEALDFRGFDLVISSSHCVAKGAGVPADSVHLSYVHAPMRYIWDRYNDYFGPDRAGVLTRSAAYAVRGYLRRWDRESSSKIDRIVCNSSFIAGQIKRAWGRDSSVVHPFAELSRFKADRIPGRNYLMVGAFAPNKRVDLAVRVFNDLGLPLLIVGGGQEERRLRALAGPSIQFLGPLSNAAIADLLSKCRAFVFPGLEDFGITPIEAMAAGAPVIAYGAGGVLETVIDGSTGVFFTPQSVDALKVAILRVESGQVTFDEKLCRQRAAEFNRDRFKTELLAEIRRAWEMRGKSLSDLESSLVEPTRDA